MTAQSRIIQLAQLLDLTRLTDNDTTKDIVDWLNNVPVLPVPVAAYCLYPEFLPQVKHYIEHQRTSAGLATVINFPTGTDNTEQVCLQIEHALAAGANEIDCVLPYRQLLKGNDVQIEDFLAVVREASSGACLKIIIESGELGTPQQIIKATELVIASGADFVKSSTGKVATGITLESAKIMLTAIAAAKRPVGFKASGGVRTIEQALQLINLYEEILEKPAEKSGMRIGASALVNEIVSVLALISQATGSD